MKFKREGEDSSRRSSVQRGGGENAASSGGGRLRHGRERREYFRVDDVFRAAIRKVENDPGCCRSMMVSGRLPEFFDIVEPDDTVPQGVWKLLVDMNAKLSLVLEKLDIGKEGPTEADNRSVNISASGVAFRMKNGFEAGDRVEVKMLLPLSPPLLVCLYGEVVRVEDRGGDGREVGIRFTCMDEEVREKIIQYGLRRQREILARKKESAGEGRDVDE